MKKQVVRLIALLFAVLFVFSSCGVPVDDPSTDSSQAISEDTGDEKELEIYIEREDKEVKNI